MRSFSNVIRTSSWNFMGKAISFSSLSLIESPTEGRTDLAQKENMEVGHFDKKIAYVPCEVFTFPEHLGLLF